MSRTLASRHIYPIYDERTERPKCHVGNSAIIFEVMCDGQKRAMRVYMRNHSNLQAIYGENYYPKELLINSNGLQFGMADVVLCDWYDGVTLQTKIEEVCASSAKMESLSQMFEEFAIQLLNERWAHGDLKPDNIIFSRDGLHLIDFDAFYCEGFTVDDCIELGTRQFQHPLRSNLNFDKRIDDYPIALITTALAAITHNPALGKRVVESDHLLIQPQLAVTGKDKMLEYIEQLFAERGDVRHYRIAKLLRSSQPTLPQLKMLLEAKVHHTTATENLTLEYYNGYWGFAEEGRFVIPPLYDLAFEFSEGLALVRIDKEWHFIDVMGRVVISCGQGCGIKPFNNGTTHICRDGKKFSIYRDGRIEEI